MPTIPKQINAIQQSLSTNTVSVDPLFQPSRTLLPTKISNVDDQPLSSSPTWNVNQRGGQQNANISTESTSGDTSVAEYQNIVELIFQEVEVSMRQSMLPQFFYLRAFRARTKERIEDYKHGLLLTGDTVPAGVELTAEFWDQRCRQAYNKHSQKGENINENPSPEPSLEDLYQTKRAIAQQSARLVTNSPITVSPSLSGPSGPVTKKQLATYSLAISGSLNLNNPNSSQWSNSTRQDIVTKYRDITQSNPRSPLAKTSSNVTLNPLNEINLSVIATQKQETDGSFEF